MTIKQVTSALTAGFMMMALAVPALAFAAPNTQVVVEADVARQAESSVPTKNWVIYTRTAAPGTAAFRSGPEAQPLGAGSLEFSTVSGSDKVFAFNYDHVGTKLADVQNITYKTYRSAGSAQQVAALNAVIDFNGPAVEGGYATLVFEPVYNTSQGSVVSGAWQNWTANGGGNWWSTQPINGQCAGATSTCDKTWAEIVANNPDATILEGVGVNQGSGNAGLTTAVDAFVFNETTYDFELYKPAAAVPTGLNWQNPTVACGGTTESEQILADWNDADNAVKYSYAVNTPTNYQTSPYTVDVTESQRAGEFNDGEGTYTFKVASYNSEGTLSAYSEGCSITYKKAVVTPPAPVVATSKDQCKNDGYLKVVNGANKTFKNQGECVSFVASNGKANGGQSLVQKNDSAY